MKNKTESIVKICDVKEQKNGSAILTIEYGSKFERFIKEYYQKKKCTKNLIEKFITNTIKLYIDRKNEKN